MSRYARAALIVLSIVVGLLLTLHVVAPRWMSSLAHHIHGRMIGDLRHALRGLRAMPLVSIVIVASLGLGIGANTTVFSWLQMVRWKPLPGVADAGRLQTIETRTAQGGYVGTSWLRFLDLQRHSRSFAWLLASRPTPLTVGDAPAVERATALFVSGNYFEALALRPAAGRLLTPGTPGRRDGSRSWSSPTTTGRRASARRAPPSARRSA